MKKITVFTEGQTEQIFLRQLIFNIFGYELAKIVCFKLGVESRYDHRDEFRYNPPEPSIHFQIINVQNDAKVLSAIIEKERNLFTKGWHEIIGLRDMYSQAYDKNTGGEINDAVTQRVLNSSRNTILQRTSRPDQISLFFSIMEIEAWFLAMHGIFQRINENFTPDFLNEQLQYNLAAIDPQTHFFKPSRELNKIFMLIDREYNKSKDDVEAIVSKASVEDYETATNNGRCSSFKLLLDKIKSYLPTDSLES